MSLLLPRLAMYALFSGLESDLRDLILVHLESAGTPNEVLGESLLSKTMARMHDDSGEGRDNIGLGDLVPYLDFAETFAILNANRSHLPDGLAKSIRELTPILEKVTSIRNRVMHFRPLAFADLATVQAAANTVMSTPHATWINLREVTHRLEGDATFLLNLQMPVRRGVQKDNLPLPDFDDTGYLGREEIARDLVNLCMRGAFPVITITGVGGLGKTALALKVASDIAERDDNPFDAVVWTSAKAATLNPREIVRIEGAIADSLQMLQAVMRQVGGDHLDDDPFAEVLQYLSEFRILLILDNLETVLDDRLRQFLRRLPSGSRVLITSRIGLGALDYPVALTPLEPAESIELIRALARARGLLPLVQVVNPKLEQYCQRMKHNPGWLKWFVSAVQSGQRPEEVLARPDIFLDFCMSNVYSYLSPTSRKVLRSMLCAPGLQSQAVLAYLNEMEDAEAVAELQVALEQLLATNMVAMRSVPRGATYQTLYEVGELPRAYLHKHHPPTGREHRYVDQRLRRLSSLSGQLSRVQQSDPYSKWTVRMPGRPDIVIAKALMDGLHATRNNQHETALEFVGRVRSLAPDYFEVHRVEAFINERMGNYPAARHAYELAIEQEPMWAPLRLWYGEMLLRQYHDVEAAQLEFAEASKLDAESVDLQLGIASALADSAHFDGAIHLINQVVAQPDLSEYQRGRLFGERVDLWSKIAARAVGVQEWADGWNALLELKAAYAQCPVELRTDEMRRKLRQSVLTAVELSIHWTPGEGGVGRIADWLAEAAGPFSASGSRRLGWIVRVGAGRYGFIRIKSTNQEVYFHQGYMSRPSDWVTLRPDSEVSFALGANREGPMAVDVEAIEQQ